RGMMMGIGTLRTSIAPAIGPTYGGIISNSLDWRYIYIFLLPLVVISWAFFPLLLEDKPNQALKKLPPKVKGKYRYNAN
ncbi:MFS transporter, partial [Shigella sonnei]|nr:MFS transporter [Shigella sonnei]